MPVSISPIGLFSRTGPAEFWAVVRPDLDVSVVDAGYSGKGMIAPLGYQIWTTGFIQTVSGGALDWITALDGNGQPVRTALESFLMALYFGGANLTEGTDSDEWSRFVNFHTGGATNLHEDILANGMAGDYRQIQADVLMAMVGGAKRYATAPDGTRVDIFALGPGDARPYAPDVNLSDASKAFPVLQRLRLWGVVPKLYAEEWIDFAQLVEQFFAFYPDHAARLAQLPALISSLRTYGAPVFTQSELDQLKAP